MNVKSVSRPFAAVLALTGMTLSSTTPADVFDACNPRPAIHDALKAALDTVVDTGGNGGLRFQMWATLVDRDGVVCAVAFSGEDRGDQWPLSRVISAQKANTANGLSLDNFALSTANLYTAVQPGGSLFGLQEANPVNTDVAYGGNASNYGQQNDPMIGGKIGGTNVFGGGLALYNSDGELVGAIGVSGDESCTDHIVAWKIRDLIGFDNVPAGPSPTGDDNIIFDPANGFAHPTCGADPADPNGSTLIANNLPVTHPIGPNP